MTELDLKQEVPLVSAREIIADPEGSQRALISYWGAEADRIAEKMGAALPGSLNVAYRQLALAEANTTIMEMRELPDPNNQLRNSIASRAIKSTRRNMSTYAASYLSPEVNHDVSYFYDALRAQAVFENCKPQELAQLTTNRDFKIPTVPAQSKQK